MSAFISHDAGCATGNQLLNMMVNPWPPYTVSTSFCFLDPTMAYMCDLDNALIGVEAGLQPACPDKYSCQRLTIHLAPDKRFVLQDLNDVLLAKQCGCVAGRVEEYRPWRVPAPAQMV